MTGLVGGTIGMQTSAADRLINRKAWNKAKRRGYETLWGPDRRPGQDWQTYLQRQFGRELGTLGDLERSGKRSAIEQYKRRRGEGRQSDVDRGMTGTRAANIRERGENVDLTKSFEDVAARLAPLYLNTMANQRNAFSELYRRYFGLKSDQGPQSNMTQGFSSGGQVTKGEGGGLGAMMGGK